MSQIWEYNGQQFEFDLMDAVTAERYEKAVAALEEKEKQAKNTSGLGNVIRYQCDMIYGFFDDIFGEGASEKLFGDNKYNLRTCSEAYFDSFIPFVNSQSRDAGVYFNRFRQTSGSAHGTNREQRRRNNKKKKK